MTVSIVDLTSGISMVAWLCEAHQAQRRADGWTVKVGKLLTWPCDDCTRGQAAPPTVDFVPTSPGARIPTAAEYPRPAPMAPWPKPEKQRPVRPQEQRHAAT